MIDYKNGDFADVEFDEEACGLSAGERERLIYEACPDVPSPWDVQFQRGQEWRGNLDPQRFNTPPGVSDDAAWEAMSPEDQDRAWTRRENRRPEPPMVALHATYERGFPPPSMPSPPAIAARAAAVVEAPAPVAVPVVEPAAVEALAAEDDDPYASATPWRLPRLRIYFVHSERRLAVQNEQLGHEDMGPPREPKGMTREALLASELAGATADLIGAERFFTAMGFGVFRDVDECRHATGFVAIGVDPADCTNRCRPDFDAWFAGRRGAPTWSRLRCKIEDVTPEEYRSAVLKGFSNAGNDPGDLWLELDFAKKWNAAGYGDSDREGRHHAYSLNWNLTIPIAYTLGVGEPPEALLAKFPLLHFTHERLTAIHKATGEQAELTLAMLEAELQASKPDDQALVPMVLEGLLPAAEISLLVGDSGIGKSTLAHQIAVAIASGASDVLGYPNQFAGQPGMAVFLSAEDGAHVFAARQRGFAQAGLSGTVLPICDPTGADLAIRLRALENVPNLRVVVVDPLKAWMKGDENSSDDMGEFVGALLDFARRPGVEVLLLHHTAKRRGGGPASLRDVMDGARGSSVLKDRVRVMLALLRRADGTSRFGVVKTNMGAAVVEHEIALRFDPATGLHHRIDTPAGKARGGASRAAQAVSEGVAPTGPQDDAAAAVEAVAAAGRKVCRTGNHSLHALKMPALAGWSRVRVVAAVDAALTAGLLVAEGAQIKVPVPEEVTGTR